MFTASFQVKEFAASPKMATVLSLKKTELVTLATHYKLLDLVKPTLEDS